MLPSASLIFSRMTFSGLRRMPTRPEEQNQFRQRRRFSNAETKFPKEAIIKYNLACYFCQMGDTENAKNYLNQAFEIDSSWRLKALDDEDLRPLWDSLA